MKLKKNFLFLLLFAAVFARAESLDYYYNGGQRSDAINDTVPWLNASGTQYNVAPVNVPNSATDLNLYRYDTETCLGYNSMIGMGVNFSVNSITNNVATQASSGHMWQFFTMANNTTFSVGNILSNATSGTSADQLAIRKRNADALFSVSITRDITVNKGIVHLGYAGSSGEGQFLTSLALGKNSEGVAIEIAGSQGDGSGNKAALNIASNQVALQQDSVINVSHGVLSFLKGIAGSTAPTAQNLDLTNATLNLKDEAFFNYGTSTGQMLGYVELGDVVVTGGVNTGVTPNNDDRTRMNFYTTATQGATADKAPVYINKITLGAAGDSSDQTRLDFVTRANAYIGSLESANVGRNGGEYQGVNFNADGYTVTIGEANLAVERMNVTGNIVVEGNFRNFYTAVPDSTFVGHIYFGNAAATFTVEGDFINDGIVRFDVNSEIQQTVVTLGGISGGTNYAQRITTTYGSRNNDGNETVIILNGQGTQSSYLGRLHDMSAGGSAAEAVAGNWAKLSIVKNGSATQILRGDNYYRGSTTVNDGVLLLRADNAGRATAPDAWGVGEILLNGGAFGAIGESGEVGLVMATNLTWTGGKILVDIDGAEADLIELSGDLLKGAGATDFEFEFNISNLEDKEYRILAFDTGGTLFDESDFTDSYKSGNYGAQFFIRDDGLYVKITAIPEPSEIAALLGLAVLLAAARRRRG